MTYDMMHLSFTSFYLDIIPTMPAVSALLQVTNFHHKLHTVDTASHKDRIIALTYLLFVKISPNAIFTFKL